jgi:hypothetical protein
MQYIEQIIQLLTWPAVILLSYYISLQALKRFEKYLPKSEEENE